MERFVSFTTCPATAAELEDCPPSGIILHRLQPSYLENEPFSFSTIHFVANIDLRKISMRSAISYILAECSGNGREHYIDLAGRRFPLHATSFIYAEVEKIDRHYNELRGGHL